MSFECRIFTFLYFNSLTQISSAKYSIPMLLQNRFKVYWRGNGYFFKRSDRDILDVEKLYFRKKQFLKKVLTPCSNNLEFATYALHQTHTKTHIHTQTHTHTHNYTQKLQNFADF